MTDHSAIRRRSTNAILNLVVIALVIAIHVICGTDSSPNHAPNRVMNDIFALIGGVMAIRSLFILWPTLLGLPFLEILDDQVIINGCKLDRHNILSARVVSLLVRGSRDRYLELAFKSPPALPILWKLSKHFNAPEFPLRCARGKALAKEPRLIVPMGKTNLTDSEIQHALTHVAGDPAPSRLAMPPPHREP